MKRNKKKKSGIIIKNHPLTRAAHYMFILPFIPVLQALLINYNFRDTIIYFSGIMLVIILVIYANQRPLIELEEKVILIHPHYRHKAEVHPYTEIISYSIMNNKRIILNSENHKPIILFLTKNDLIKLKNKLASRGIHEKENN
jgi:hypothetical protein